MSFYADSSLLISYYLTDSNSSNAQAVIHATHEPLPFAGLLKARGFFTFDARQRSLAIALGLAVKP